MQLHPTLPLSAVLLSLFLGAGDPTSSSISIGGPGSCSSEGYDDPGRLSDGVTEASATFAFTLDPGLARLTLRVTNTSRVVSGVKNPLLTDLFFNAPAAVTGMSLVSQSSAGGVAPQYQLSFDSAPGQGADPGKAGRFGAFGVRLADTGNIQGAIANPDADTYTVSAGQLAVSPCDFVLELSGDLSGLSADDFTSLLSVIPPGSKRTAAAAKFQAGGRNDASAFISDGEECPNEGTSQTLGAPCGGSLSVTAPVPGGISEVSYDGSTPGGFLILAYGQPGAPPFSYNGCTIFLGVNVRLLGPYPVDGAGDFHRSFSVPATHACGDQIVLQAVVQRSTGTRPVVEISNGVLVTMGS